MELTKQENKNKRTAMVTAIALHCIIFILAGLGLFSCGKKIEVAGSEISVVFGTEESGNSTEPAAQETEEIVEKVEPVEPQPVEEQPDPTEDVSATDPDTDSEATATDIPKPVKPIDPTPVKPTKPVEPTKPVKEEKKPVIDASSLMGPNSKGEGDDDETGNKGKEDGTDDVNKDGEGGAAGSQGKGPALLGWKLDDQLEQPDISSTGVAEIRFTIDKRGYVINARVIKGPFTAAEKKKIEDKVKKATFTALNKTADMQSQYTGIYKWEFTF